MRLLLTVKFPGIGSRLDAAGSQGNVHSLLHKPLADTLHRRETDKKRFTDPPVGPSGISFEQYVRPSYLSCRMLPGADNLFQLVPLLLGQINDIFLGHDPLL
jgi:hypothetical protein